MGIIIINSFNLFSFNNQRYVSQNWKFRVIISFYLLLIFIVILFMFMTIVISSTMPPKTLISDILLKVKQIKIVIK